MQIVKDTVVTLNYTVRDPDGNMIDDGHHPLVYLHGGYDGIFSKLEETLQGKDQGETLQVKLQPDDAFGEYDEALVLVEEQALFPDNIEVGMSFERVTEDGDEEIIELERGSDHEVLGIDQGYRAVPFLRRLIGGRTLSISAIAADGRELRAVLGLEGLDKAIGSLRNACHW